MAININFALPKDLGFKRSLYLTKIEKYLGNDLVKVIIGQRRVGKSYILRQIMDALIKDKKAKLANIIYINKELIEFDDIKTYKDLFNVIKNYRKTKKITGKLYIFLDEVQEIIEWEKAVNSLSQNKNEKAEVIITGSNSKMLSSELSTYLSGRYVDFEVYPFSYGEFCDYLKIQKSRESYIQYLSSGGIPELFHLQDNEAKRHYIDSLKNTILLKDIVEKYKIKDVTLLENLYRFLLDNIGNLFSANKIVKYLTSHGTKTNYETISNYLSYITQTYLIHEVNRYDVKGKDILSGNKKYYSNDLSFKNFLSSNFDEGIGKHLENAIFIEAKLKGYTVYVGTIGKQEVDFVLEKNGEKKYIQTCFSIDGKKVIEREFGNFEMIKDNYEKMVVSLDEFPFGNRSGIKHVRAWELKL